MDQTVYTHAKVLWDYMHMNMPLQKADYIVGFGCYSEEIALRCADLWKEGWAPKIIFTGGLGRNTKEMWTRSEAERFADVAMAAGVPEEVIRIENKSTNTAENILFTKAMVEGEGVKRIIGVHKPFMERRVYAAMGVYWPQMQCILTSPQLTIPEYVELSKTQGISEKRVIEILVGDFQRIDLYAQKGYQLPQDIPQTAWDAFDALVSLGYTRELVK